MPEVAPHEFNTATMPLDSNQLIEASAGTGKTYTITNLCLRLLLGRDAPELGIDQILILTFTRAATAELKERIARRISQARKMYRTGEGDEFLVSLYNNSSDPERDLKLLTAASQLMDDAAIFTIHSFCARVLGERAFDAGLLFDQELNADRDQILNDVVQDYFRSEILTLPSTLRDIALTLWKQPQKLASDMKPFLFREIDQVYPEGLDSFDPYDLLNKAIEARARWLDENLEDFIDQSSLHGSNRPKRNRVKMTAFCRDEPLDLQAAVWSAFSAPELAKADRKDNFPGHPVLSLINEVVNGTEMLNAWFFYQARRHIQDRIRHHKEAFNQHTLDDLLTLTADAVSAGGGLPQLLAARWPVALIDEFQDTDSVQYRIFREIYPAADNDSNLIMIGDPKQAIYHFRGADVFTYFNARQETRGQHTLSVNWRSSPAYLDAVNFLFGQDALFGEDAALTYAKVSAPPDHQAMTMKLAGEPVSPFQVFCCGSTSDYSLAGPARSSVMEYAAEEASRLISGSNKALLDDNPVTAGQIAFLVRDRNDARAARRALRKRGIDSVYLTQESIFSEQTALDVHTILESIMDPGNERSLRAAAGTRLMQLSLTELDQLNDQLYSPDGLWEAFVSYGETWQHQGIAAMLGRLLNEQTLGQRWLQRPSGKRELTNFRHLAEVLQQQAGLMPGRQQLVNWLAGKITGTEPTTPEEEQLRLESDQNLVQIVTMHAAKGLQYDIVFVPRPISSGLNRGFKSYLFHEQQQGIHSTALDLIGQEPSQQHAKREAMEEEIRLLYVALTRAKYRCYLGLPKLKTINSSAISKLLSIGEIEKDSSLLDIVGRQLPGNLFDVVDGNDANCTFFDDVKPAGHLVSPSEQPRPISRWRVHSYTGMLNRIRQHQETEPVHGFTDDDPASQAETTNTPSRFNLERGPRIGVALHSLMEEIDFLPGADNTAAIDRLRRRLNLDARWQPVISDWLDDILTTPIADHTLASISKQDRLDEMEFHFSIDAAEQLIGWLIQENVITSSNLSSLQLTGMMTGFVDLLYRSGGRYYVVDYKSNHLGNSVEDYRQASLEQAMSHHDYHLQYLIYSVALHRHLSLRLDGYDFDQHFGGAHYLFLRGMNGQSQSGVFSNRPPREVVIALDDLLGGAH